MIYLDNNTEFKKVTISSLITCIYLPSVITTISYSGLLYSLGKRSSSFVLIIVTVAEFLKVIYLRKSNIGLKKNKHVKNKASELMKSFGFLICAAFAFFVGIILFGAPILDKHEETLNLAVLLTLLTTFPLVTYAGVEEALQLLLGVKNYSKGTVIEMFVNNAILTVCGGWIGAVVIPLDWNTPWQEWPIPCYLGVIGGYLLSNILTIIKAIAFSAAVKYPSLTNIVNIMYSPQSK